MKRAISIAAVALILAGGCSGNQTLPQLEPVDLTVIKPKDPDTLASNYVNSTIKPSLKDPESMRATITPGSLTKRRCFSRRQGSGKVYFDAWASAVQINAKNSYGGYTGNQTYLIYYVGGRASGHFPVAGSLTNGVYMCPPVVAFY